MKPPGPTSLKAANVTVSITLAISYEVASLLPLRLAGMESAPAVFCAHLAGADGVALEAGLLD